MDFLAIVFVIVAAGGVVLMNVVLHVMSVQSTIVVAAYMCSRVAQTTFSPVDIKLIVEGRNTLKGDIRLAVLGFSFEDEAAHGNPIRKTL